MNPQEIFCPNIDCPARGQIGKGNIGIHSQKEQRYICDECQETFTATKGTIFYRLRTDPKIVLQVITLQAYGCPIQAIVQAFGLDERTVQDWWERAGKHCQAVHEHKVEQAKLDLQQVQADEIKVKTFFGTVWMALAIMVSTRLWLGGAVSSHRDLDLIQTLANQIRNLALCRPLLLAVDGLASYVTAFHKAFRTALPKRRGEMGRPHLISWPDIAIVQVVKHRIEGHLSISRRIVQGSEAMVKSLPRDRASSIPHSSNASMPLFANALIALSGERAPWLARFTLSRRECMWLAACTISVIRTIACVSSCPSAASGIVGFSATLRLRPVWLIISGPRLNCSTYVSRHLVGSRPASAVAARWLPKNSSKGGAHDHV